VPGCLVLVIAILAVLSFEPQIRDFGKAIKKKVPVDVWISIVKRPKEELPTRTLRKANDFARRLKA